MTKETHTRLGKNSKEVNYTWDSQNRLAGITYHAANTPAFMPILPDNTINFVYDDAGNRVKKVVNGETSYYINDGLTVLNELDSDGNVTKSIIKGLEQVAEIDREGNITFVHQDVLGSAVLLTNQAGEIVQQYEYDPFGQILSMSGTAETDYLFTGQEWDAESELYYYNARYYNPRLGRFISRDSVLGRDGDALSRNGYIYVKNNPLKYVDPSGNDAKKAQKKWWQNQTFNDTLNVLDNTFSFILDIPTFGGVSRAKALSDKIDKEGLTTENLIMVYGNTIISTAAGTATALNVGAWLGATANWFADRSAIQTALSQPVKAPDGYKWSQPEFFSKFSNPKNSEFPYKGMEVENVAVKVNTGEVAASDLRSYTVERNGVKYIYNSRSCVTCIVAGKEPNLVPLTREVSPNYDRIMKYMDERLQKYGEQGFDTIIKSNSFKFK